MTKQGRNFVTLFTLLFFPFAALSQDNPAVEALNQVKSEIKQLSKQEKKQRKADINSLRSEIDNLLRITEQLSAEISALKKGHGVSYSSAKATNAAVVQYEQLSGLSGLADSVGRPRFAIATGLALWGADRFAETGRGASTLTSGMITKLGTWLKEFF